MFLNNRKRVNKENNEAALKIIQFNFLKKAKNLNFKIC